MVKGKHLNAGNKPMASGDNHALFLDFDGTLTDIVANPDQVIVEPDLLKALAEMQTRLEGALAVISGRATDVLDRLLYPLKFSAAGIHGAEFRLGQGPVERVPISEDRLRQAQQAAREFAQSHPGVLFESKPLAFSLHYRQAPQFAAEVERFMRALIESGLPDFDMQPGKMVVELKPRGCHKGQAIARFMKQPPFQSRIPIYLGDDVTDEQAFRTVNAMKGISIKVGAGPTCASARLESPAGVLQWLKQRTEHPGAGAAMNSGIPPTLERAWL